MSDAREILKKLSKANVKDMSTEDVAVTVQVVSWGFCNRCHHLLVGFQWVPSRSDELCRNDEITNPGSGKFNLSAKPRAKGIEDERANMSSLIFIRAAEVPRSCGSACCTPATRSKRPSRNWRRTLAVSARSAGSRT